MSLKALAFTKLGTVTTIGSLATAVSYDNSMHAAIVIHVEMLCLIPFDAFEQHLSVYI